jgi:glycosyltransferase involved in cell wall biosynthesis
VQNLEISQLSATAINWKFQTVSNRHPLVTLVLLAYKQETFIREAVESALSQTYRPLEIVISDDCSPDGTFTAIQKVLDQYQGHHQIILNRNPHNLGLGAHFEKALSISSGDWIVAAAGDDISEPARIDRLVEAVLTEENVVAAASSWKNIDSQGQRLADNLPRRFRHGCIHRQGEYDWVNGFIKGGDTGVPGMSAMWHRSLFDNFPKMSHDIVAEDIVLGFRAYLTGSIVFLKDQLVRHRFHHCNAAAFTSDDPEWMENQKIIFAKKQHSSIEANSTDYQHHLKSNHKIQENPQIIHLIRISIWRNALTCNWWDHGLIWKLQSLIRLGRMHSYSSMRYAIIRLLPKTWFLKLSRFLMKIHF